jgi:ATP-dependent Clp protease ATP-binding subunit ClpC
MFEDDSKDSGRRRIVELCGMDPDAVLAERDARPTERPGAAAKLQEALELAGDDAFRRGQTDIRPENLLFGLLRAGGLPVLFFTKVSGIDFERFRADVWDRVRPDLGRVERPQLALDLSAQAVMQAAIGAATERRRQMLTTVHVLYVLMLTDDGVAAELLTRYGANVGKLRAEMEGSL